VSILVLTAALLGLLSRAGGHSQDVPATKVKRAVYFVRHCDATELAVVLARHFKGDADVQAVPAGNYLLVRAEAGVVDEAAQLLARLDRPRAVSVELLIVDLSAPSSPARPRRSGPRC